MWSQLGLRATVTVSFAAGALFLSIVLALGTYLVARHYLIDQRESTATRQAFADASYVRDGLRTSGVQVSDVLGGISSPAGSDILLHRGNRWFSSSLDVGQDTAPASVRRDVAHGLASMAWTTSANGPAVVVGIPLPAVGAQFYEVSSSDELGSTLVTLRAVLIGFAILTTLGGALLGRTAARRLMSPLHDIAGAAVQISSGQLNTRLPATDDPELATIVGSFNSMVEALDERIRRDARFSADVSHELRSPLTTLMASVAVLQRRRDELSPRSRQALDLVSGELDRFHQSLEDLLELGRLDAGPAGQSLSEVDPVDLVRHALRASRRPTELLREPVDGGTLDGGTLDGGTLDGGTADRSRDAAERPRAVLSVDKQQLNRALVNLFENADRHGGGLVEVGVERRERYATIIVDDCGPGVAAEDRQRIFERFARAGSRGSRPGTGLGLSLVAETAHAHGGTVWCSDRPGGGARFSLRLPLHPLDGNHGDSTEGWA